MMIRHRHRHRPRRCGVHRLRGVYLILFALILIVLVGCIGMVLDVAQVYNRKTELQNVADGAALAAARELNGTSAGVTLGRNRAQAIAQANKYQFFTQSVVWSDAALRFSNIADGDWVDLAVAQAAPTGMRFARVDTAALDAAHGAVPTSFIRAVVPAVATITTSGVAVAGPVSLNITPLAVCALDPANRNGEFPHSAVGTAPASVELLEYGFRRGVGYNLLGLNPTGVTPLSFAVNPIDPTSGPNNGANLTAAALAPFVCTGTMLGTRLPDGATVYVSSPFPSALIDHLNSRFNLYTGSSTCNVASAPPDKNIRRYDGSYAPGWWMNYKLPGQSDWPAARRKSAGALGTRADRYLGVTETVVASDHGTLWAYASAVKWAEAEPAGGYVPYVRSNANWASLYQNYTGTGTSPDPVTPTASAAYPTGPSATLRPYTMMQGNHFQAPTGNTGAPNRRVLNVPLLSCPVAPGGPATVLGIGGFLMTSIATMSPPAVLGEFLGLASDQSVVGTVALYR